jgi:toxin ParE1/3/4
MKASLSDEAIDDARAAADWFIDQGADDAADAFFDDIERSIRLLERHPRIGTPGIAGTRSLCLHTFPHSLVYRLAGEDIRIIAVAAHRRRPGYWLGRR